MGSAALKVVSGGRFDNRTNLTAILEFVNCSADAIASDVASSGNTLLWLRGTIRFGNIAGRGIYNSDPGFTILNEGLFETMPGGKMNLQASISNSGAYSMLANNDGTVTLGYAFSNSGTVTNGGTITNSAAFTNASGGQIFNNGTWTMTGTFNNSSGGVCRGTGTFQGSVFNNAGTVAPGNSPGCLQMSNGFLNQSTGILAIEVNGKNTPCTQFDRLNVNGTAAISGLLNVTFGGAYTPVVNDEITILKSSSLSGVFSGHNLPNGWTILYNTPANGDITLKRIAALPLSLSRFAAQKDGNNVSVSWTTTNEVNTSHFELERSADGSQFQKIGTVASVNAADDYDYAFTDADPLTGRNYYRLKMVDIDRTYTYSWVVSLNMDKPQPVVSAIYPNPSKDIVNITVAENSNELSIQLISQNGKTLLTKRLTVSGTYPLNVAALPAGIYFIKVSNGETHKLIKQ